MSDEMKPCPFCGHSSVSVVPDRPTWVECDGCWCVQLGSDWNHRPIEARLAGIIERLRRVVEALIQERKVQSARGEAIIDEEEHKIPYELVEERVDATGAALAMLQPGDRGEKP